MKKTALAAIALAAALGLSGCGGETSPAEEDHIPPAEEEYGPLPKEPEPETEPETALDLGDPWERYADPAALAPAEDAPAGTFVFDDRTLTVEDAPENEVEALIYTEYYSESAADFETYSSLYGKDEVLNIIVESTIRDFYEGIYMSAYTLHDLSLLTEEEINALGEYYRTDMPKSAGAFALDPWAVVQLDFTLAHNQASLARGPDQISDGRYRWCYLCGKTADDPQWKIYGFYWEDFLVDLSPAGTA